MKKAIPMAVVLISLGVYVYFYHVRPARLEDPTVRGFGTVEAEEIIVSPRIAAQIESISVDEGSQVSAGQPLVTLRCDDIKARLNQALAQVRAAEAAVAQANAAKKQVAATRKQARANMGPYLVGKEKAERELERAVTLSEQNSIALKAVDDAKAEVDVARERIVAAEQGVTVTERGIAVADQTIGMAEAQVALAKAGAEVIATQLSDCALAAPRAGVVAAKNYNPGELVLPGASILKIHDKADVFTWIYVPNEEIGRVRLGQSVKLVADTYPGRTFSGKVVRINEEAEFTPKSIQTKKDRTQLVYGVKVALENSGGSLLPGMPVEASLVEGPAGAANRTNASNR